MKIIVAGGRDFSDYNLVKKTLLGIHSTSPITLLVQGGATGADFLGKRFANEYGIPCIEYPADWKRYGKSAGPKRNAQMAEHPGIECVILFPGGRGTQHMENTAILKGIPILKIPYNVKDEQI